MSGNRKPRKTYRPRAVTLDALARLQPVEPYRSKAVHAQLLSALDQIARGIHPGKAEWSDLADAINTVAALVHPMGLLEPAETSSVVKAAELAMADAMRRHHTRGRMGFDGPGLQAVRDAVAIYHQCCCGFTAHAMFEARRHVQVRMALVLAGDVPEDTEVVIA